MTKRSIFLLNLLAAGILAVTAQSLLLVPQQQGILIGTLSFPAVISLALFFLAVSYMDVSAVLLYSSKKRYQVTCLFTILALGMLAALYARGSLFVETLLLIGLAISHLVIFFNASKDSQQQKDYLIGLAFTVNTLLGIGFLFFPNLLNLQSYDQRLFPNAALGVAFLVASIIDGYVFATPSTPLNRLFSKLAIFPWLAWSLNSIALSSLPMLIPSLLFFIAILLSDLIPWSKLILPANDVLGHRALPAIYTAQTLILALLSLLLYLNKYAATPGNALILTCSRELTFVFFIGLTLFSSYGIATLHSTINRLVAHLFDAIPDQRNENVPAVGRLKITKRGDQIAQFIAPFFNSQQDLQTKVVWQENQIQRLSEQLNKGKRRAMQFALLSELRKQLENQLDEPVAAQLVVSTIQRAFHAELATIMMYDMERRELVALAVAGDMRVAIPSGYRQSINKGIIGRAARLLKTQVVNDTRLDPDFLALKNQTILSEVVIPLIHHGHLKGVLTVEARKSRSFSTTDVATLEAAASELMNAWERSGYNQRLTTLIQAGISLSTLLEPQAAIREVAIIARQALQARFTFATLIDQDSNFTRIAHAGYAPNLLKSLSTDQASNALLQNALNALRPFRIRDVRKYKHASPIVLDHKMLRGLLVIPVRLHRMSIGAILAFGKQGGIFFSEKDESLASLLASQAAAAIESAWLIQELRTTLSTTTLLYQLSFRVIQAENLKEAARVIAETAYKLAKASVAGIVLFNADQEIETEVEVSADGTKTTARYPMTMVEQTLATGQHIVLSSGQSSSQIYIPIQTHLRKYGVLWMEFTENERHVSSQSTTLQTLTNQAAIALERAILLTDSRKQAEEIKAAYRELEITYDQTLAALTSALDARDRETEGHSTRVGKIACRLGKDLGLSPTQLKALARGSLLHDIGKIGISDTILHKPGPLNADEWRIMRQHPKIGTQIVADIPFLQDTLPIIHYHQERWDGSGYPLGLNGADIPLLARIFAVADAFDALTSNRPYRERISNEEALEFLRKQAGVLFDPDIVAAFDRLISENSISDIIAPP